MPKKLPSRSPKRSRKARSISPSQSKQLERAMDRVARVASIVGRKDEVAQRNARLAIADTVEDWLDWLAEEDPQAAEDFYVELEILASASNRRRIQKHALRPDGVDERVERELSRLDREVTRTTEDGTKASASGSQASSEEAS